MALMPGDHVYVFFGLLTPDTSNCCLDGRRVVEESVPVYWAG